MFSAGDTHICDECVMFCYDILEEQSGGPGAKAFSRIKKDKVIVNGEITLKKPAEIKAVLDEYVIDRMKLKLRWLLRYITITNELCRLKMLMKMMLKFKRAMFCS